MIKLTNILNQLQEGIDPIEIGKDEETLQLIKDTCFYDENMPIYKGFRSIHKPSKFIKITDNGIRKSANTRNYYTILISEILDSWEDYPKRNRALICSSKFRTASSYSNIGGYAYRIFPNKSVDKIGVCSSSDFWSSFSYLKAKTAIYDMDDFNYTFLNLCHNTISKFDDSRLDDANTMKEVLKELSNSLQIENYDNTKSWIILGKYIQDNYNSDVLKGLNDLLSPEKNNFKLLTIPEFLNQSILNSEVWFELKGDSYGEYTIGG